MRIIRTKDHEQIARLNETVQTLHANLYPEVFQPYQYEEVAVFFKEMVKKPEMVFLVLVDKKDIGYAWVEVKHRPANAFKKAEATLYIHQISIHADVHGKGYGSALLAAIEELAREERMKRIDLDYWIDNTQARMFYEKRGFQLHRQMVYKPL
ncbi:GNAT family N-acetyltransferase [Ectobacillus sp. JY-23]|uniref:GNAT family N-acetyltransferase n=1 Tax=Ectobacillus sp. JY-23 TaxID=2933872 RepID=UPI001FF68DDA|nr:GNAT family N-acetyltransferase [Ectobacillus sp. JY-23]UOY92568.1 GNAT family N-acetyltransferase [Ectobacillus sp. JY-23]